MSGGNLTPRQKMINMMYLVLTALLALNVSAEILKAFHLVEVSLAKSSDNVERKNTETWRVIEKAYTTSKDPITTNSYQQAQKARQISGDLVKYIEDLKQQVVAGADGRKEDTNGDGKTDDEEVTKPDDTENHANLMINNKKGEELRAKINKAKEDLFNCLSKEEQKLVQSDLNTEDMKHEGETQKWESVLFEHTPAAAVITLLTKLQNDTRNTEAQVLEILKSKLTGDAIIVEDFTAKVIPNNGTYITAGGKYSADVFLAASTRMKADISVNGTPLKVDELGVGKYEVIASGEGEKKYKAVITTKKSNGAVETRTVEAEYFVIKPLAVISADAMNVVYVGLENPISVSVPGYSANDVTVTASGASLRPGKVKGTYTLTVPAKTREVVVSASVKNKSTNATQKMGDQKYRVKAVPSPTVQLGSLKSGNYPSGVVKSQQFVLAVLENFAYEGIKYSVTSFSMAHIPKSGKSDDDRANGAALTPKMKAMLNKVQSGDKIMIYGVKANGPAGAKNVENPLMIQIN